MTRQASWFFGGAVAEQPETALFPPEKGKLHIIGEHFYSDQNQLWQWRGFSWFLGFLRFCRGEDVTADLRYLRANGFNLVRIFGPLPWKETPDYRLEFFDWSKLPAFLELQDRHGIRAEWSLFHYRADIDRLRAFAQRFLDVMAHRGDVVEFVNEPHVGEKPDPVDIAAGLDRRGVLCAYGLYPKPGQSYRDVEVLDFGTVHTPRDDAWHRKARIAQEIQHSKGQPWISDEPAKAIEVDFNYPGGKRNPDEFVWHHGVASLWTSGSTVHTEEGKWGRVPKPGMLQYRIVEAVRDQVWKKIDASWQEGGYAGAHMSISPVDGKGLKIDGQDIWTYSSVHQHKALNVRCAVHPPQPKPGWTTVDRWGPGGSLVRLSRG